MGTNRRYAESIGREADARERDRQLAEIMQAQPLSLTPPELELDRLPLTRTPVAERVRVWVRYPSGAVRIEARAVAWTPRAVACEWETPAGITHRGWLWASAVERM